MRTVKCSIAWAMPNKWTFQIQPIHDFVIRWIHDAKVIVDPFCGTSTLATHRNDLARGGIDAEDYCDLLIRKELVADAIIFDPPYSLRQIEECYDSIGKKVTGHELSLGFATLRPKLASLLKAGGVALSFGWNSMGFGKQWPIEELLLVQHGGAHTDTICVCQRKPFGLFD